MTKKSFKLEDITIKYGQTTVQELLGKGYSVGDWEQIVEEPTLAQCNLYQDGKKVASLAFYTITEPITLAELGNFPIDFAVRENGVQPLSSKQALKNKVKYTIIIHLVAIGLFYCIYAFPILLEIVRESGAWGRHRRSIGGLGMFFLILPSVLVAFVWSGSVIGEKGMIGKKIILSLWIIANAAISLAYLVFIDNMFTGRFF